MKYKDIQELTDEELAKKVEEGRAELFHHPKYGKMMTISKKLHCHDEKNECGLGDTVTVMETRPLSKTKRWRVVEIVERAK